MENETPTILIVDDDEDIRELLKDRLEFSGYRVPTAPDGIAGLERIREEAPDLVLLDLMMPRLDGLGVMRRITEEKLVAVGALEDELRAMGFAQFRVRHHGDIARIEVEPDAIVTLCAPDARSRIVSAGKAAGFLYVAIDLQGYRTGSMNEALAEEKKHGG